MTNSVIPCYALRMWTVNPNYQRELDGWIAFGVLVVVVVVAGILTAIMERKWKDD